MSQTLYNLTLIKSKKKIWRDILTLKHLIINDKKLIINVYFDINIDCYNFKTLKQFISIRL